VTTGPVPIAVAGYGRVACAVHLPLIERLSTEFRLVAIVESDHDRARLASAHRPDVAIVSTLAAAAGAGAEAVICATPWPTHAGILAEALELGLDALCEKPVSLDPDEIADLTDRQKRSGSRVLAGYMKRHDPTVRRFLAAVRKRPEELRSVTVTVIDPNNLLQVAHLLPPGIGLPDPATRHRGDEAASAILGPVDPVLRTVFTHGLGGSLTHHINLVRAALAGSPWDLPGALSHAEVWHDGAGVCCLWQPSAGFTVQMSHLRVPEHRRYRETIQAVTDDGVLTLRLPSPYARDEGAVLEIENGDPEQLSREEVRSPVGRTGFECQLRAWAAQLRGDADGPLPDLDEVAADLRVVMEVMSHLRRHPGARRLGADVS
jgi:predicted dehydrogenase